MLPRAVEEGPWVAGVARISGARARSATIGGDPEEARAIGVAAAPRAAGAVRVATTTAPGEAALAMAALAALSGVAPLLLVGARALGMALPLG